MFNDNTYVKVNVCIEFFRILFSPVAFIMCIKNPRYWTLMILIFV